MRVCRAFARTACIAFTLAACRLRCAFTPRTHRTRLLPLPCTRCPRAQTLNALLVPEHYLRAAALLFHALLPHGRMTALRSPFSLASYCGTVTFTCVVPTYQMRALFKRYVRTHDPHFLLPFYRYAAIYTFLRFWFFFCCVTFAYSAFRSAARLQLLFCAFYLAFGLHLVCIFACIFAHTHFLHFAFLFLHFLLLPCTHTHTFLLFIFACIFTPLHFLFVVGSCLFLTLLSSLVLSFFPMCFFMKSDPDPSSGSVILSHLTWIGCLPFLCIFACCVLRFACLLPRLAALFGTTLGVARVPATHAAADVLFSAPAFYAFCMHTCHHIFTCDTFFNARIYLYT